ncbi:hypothetical protein ACFL40_01090 [candidate division KSB1 bacterium]
MRTNKYILLFVCFKICVVVFACECFINDVSYSSTNPRVIISVNAKTNIGSLPHIWNGFMGNACLTITPDGEKLLSRVVKTSQFPYLRRVWGLTRTDAGNFESYGSTNVYNEDDEGNPFYDYTLIDQIYDVLISKDIIPMPCIGFMPRSLTTAPDSRPGARRRDFYSSMDFERYPPKDYEKWYTLVYNIVKHCIDRYGRKSVAQWKWELWNEPDIRNYWRGTEEEFIKMYDYTAAAVKDAFPEAQVGGNAVTHNKTRGTPFLIKFIKHCLHETNYRDPSIKGAPLDFITFHLKGGNIDFQKVGNFTSGIIPYKGDKFSPSLQFILTRARENLQEISAVEGSENIPIYITECDIDIGLTIAVYENPVVRYRNTEYHAAFQCALAKEMLEVRKEFPKHPIERLIIDGFFYPGRRIFEGQRALFTAGGIDKPVFNAFRVLGKLGTERLEFKRSSDENIDGIAARSKDNSVQIMVYNYQEDVEYKDEKEIELSVNLPDSKYYKLKHYRIDQEHSNAYTVWSSMGKPVTPDDNQMKIIKARMGLELYEPERKISPENGKYTTSFNLPHHSVSLLVFEPME